MTDVELKAYFESVNKTIAASGVQMSESIDEMRRVLKEHNGRLRDVEIEQVSIKDCQESLKELPDKVRKLEDENLSNISIKKFTTGLFLGGVALGGLIIGIIELIK